MEAGSGISDRLRELVEADWAWQLSDSPEYATLVGQDSQAPAGVDSEAWLLDDLSLTAFEKRETYHAELVAQLKNIDETSLEKGDRLTHKLLLDQAATYLAGAKHRAFLMRLSNLEGPHIDFLQVMKASRTSTDEDLCRYIARLKAFPTQCSQAIELLRRGIAEGRTVPKVCLSDVEEQLEQLLTTDPSASPLMMPFNDAGAAAVCSAIAEHKSAALVGVRDLVYPAFRGLLDFVRREYLPGARAETPCSALPDGTAAYEALLRFHTSTDLTAQQIHEAGHDEVKRITKQMEAAKAEAGFSGDLEAFIDFLRKDPQFFVDSEERLLEMYRLRVEKVYEKLPELFGDVPDHKLDVVATPSHQAPSAPAAYYYSQGPSRPGLFYVNTHHLSQRPVWQMDVLTLHEAVPGHHLQAAVAVSNQLRGELPSFRANMEDRRYGTAPSRRPFYSSYVEGWALYCEGLGKDLGLYQDVYSWFGRLSMDMMRACRLVVDTGLHALGWSRDEAVAFMAQHCAQPLHEVEAEVTRYIAWPAQATAYKVGELEFWRMRRDIEATALKHSLDTAAAIRSFHDLSIACGSVPLSLLHKMVFDDFIPSLIAEQDRHQEVQAQAP